MTIKSRDYDNLKLVICAIVDELNRVNLFTINKLVYLFEYFHIKNFGERFTKEYFLKITHGPVICNYKKLISEMIEEGYLDGNIDNINKKRKVDQGYYENVFILPGKKKTLYSSLLTPEKRLLLKNILIKYSSLSTKNLESVVYATKPMLNYQNDSRKQDGKPHYVLDSSGIKLKEFKNALTESKKRVKKHREKYPTVDKDQQEMMIKEFSYLEEYRPEWEA